MEEPELGLHPDALALFASVMVEASARPQIIVTTHSDVLVSALTEQAEMPLSCSFLCPPSKVSCIAALAGIHRWPSLSVIRTIASDV